MRKTVTIRPIAVTLLVMVVLIGIFVSGCGKKVENSESGELILATTTSTLDSGLLDELLPAFEKEYGVKVKPIAVGTGEAIKMGELGDADVLLVHAKFSEEEFVNEGYGLERVAVMYNDFVIVGPDIDPAGTRGMKSAAEAFEKIAETGSAFVSRGDDSGTNQREKEIWEEAGIDPAGNSWYLETGQGMGQTLTVAGEKQGYTLSDRATYLSRKDTLDLVILFEGDKTLSNQYSAIVVNPEKHPALELNTEAAGDLIKFLTGEKGQEMIGSYEKYETVLFHPNAKGESRGIGSSKER